MSSRERIHEQDTRCYGRSHMRVPPNAHAVISYPRSVDRMAKGISSKSVVMTLIAVSWTTSAVARIQCQGDFRVTNSSLIATPYCEEENIAFVAQSYGWRVTPSQVHNNPLKKVYICQVLGRDVRLKASCAGYSPDNFGGG